ncbi:hypothetical protein NQ314_006578 [Rhamnusium bicolor]|uniref:Uncharacterized protein n=1 Tax=Rhamnusium bicolor TaxID=1586634 RepID=A0AAV8Z118_9CUCU|nr:hypothetical protein NQ314_006578 [Rhamnusium bicolor]
MSHKVYLSDKQLEEIVNNLTDSEDGFDFSDDDSVADPNYLPHIEADPESDIIEDLYSDPDEEYEELVENESNDEPASEDNLPSTSADHKNQQNNKPRCSNEGIKEKKKKGNLFETTGKCMLICICIFQLVKLHGRKQNYF